MLASRQGRRRTAASWAPHAPTAAVLPAATVLAGCGSTSAGPPGSAAWSFIALALLLVAGVAYAAGHARARLLHEHALRAARGGQRQLALLQDGWHWQTDASHRLLSWHPASQAGQPGPPGCLLFDPGADSPLLQHLHSQQAFDGLRVRVPRPQNGHFGWQLRGVPGHDDLGRFNGFSGSATPTDDSDATNASAAALPPLLAAWPAPALVALDPGSGWRLAHVNAAAQAQWPGLAAGDALDQGLADLPPELRGSGGDGAGGDGEDGGSNAAAAAGSAGDALQAGAWQLLPFDAGPAGRGLVLTRQPDAGTGTSKSTSDDASAQAGEGDNFSFTVSHDLRAPIRVVEGFTRIVKEDYGRLLDRVGNDHLDRVLGAAARMNLMIDALLTLARLSAQPLARQPVNLSQLAAYVMDDLRRAAPERDAEIDIQPALSAQGDPTLLRLVLENLLGNAWKYSARSHRAQISLRAEPHGPRTAFVVRDNGAGFDMRSADRLFGLFQRLHSASEFPGHGVGLASVRRIVRRHGGDIWAEAEPGRGAAFFFTLG